MFPLFLTVLSLTGIGIVGGCVGLHHKRPKAEPDRWRWLKGFASDSHDAGDAVPTMIAPETSRH